MSIYVWGSNKCKQLPEEKYIHRYGPDVVSSSNFEAQIPIQVVAGDGHTVVLSESGDVFSFGRSREGQLGRLADGNTNKVHLRDYTSTNFIVSWCDA
jgi:alpha-tubulin suppressor-like RCC1 family protein